MNIFFLDRNPFTAAKYHCDKHVVKMILETAQLLSTAHRIEVPLDPSHYDAKGYYKITHANHPCAVWVRSSRTAYVWTALLLIGLCMEYTKRYGKTHKVESSGLIELLAIPPASLENDDLTDPPQCMPEEYKGKDTVSAYRAYYAGAKSSIAKWKHSEKPEWWIDTPVKDDK